MSAVATGVAVILAIDVASVSARKSFQLSLQALTGKSNYVLSGAGQGVQENFYRTLRVDWGIRRSSPVVEGYLSFPDPEAPDDSNRAIPLTLLGVDPLADREIRGWTGGQFQSVKGGAGGGLSDLIGSADQVVAGAQTARRLQWELGQKRRVLVGNRTTVLELAGVFEPADDRSSAALDNVLLTDISVAQTVFQRYGVIDRIDLVLAEEEVAALEQRLPEGLFLYPAGQSQRTAAELSDAFHINLQALSYLCLLVATFLIFNVVSFSISHRRQSLGRLRVVGVGRQELGRLLMGEALFLGLLGGLLGVVGGLLLGRLLVPLVTRTLNDLYYVHAITRFDVEWWLLAKAFFAGLAATALAAAAPAWAAARQEPLDLLYRSQAPAEQGRAVAGSLGLGIILLILALAILSHPSLTAGLLSLLLLVLGYAFTVPAWLLGASRVFSRLPQRVASRMAVRGLATFLGRTSMATVALTVAVAATISIAMMVNSFRGTLVSWLEATLTADVYISLKDRAGLTSGASLEASKVAQAIKLPGVQGWAGQRLRRVPSSTGETYLVGARAGGKFPDSLVFLEAVPEMWQRFEAGEGVFVTEPYARRAGLSVGSSLTLTTSLGRRSLPVLGVYYSYAPDRNLALLHFERYRELFDDKEWSGIGLYLNDSADSSRMVEELLRVFGEQADIRATGNLKALALEIFERTFTVTEVLRFLALGVAFLGVLLSLLALALERSQEVNVLRALGFSRRELFQLSLRQSLLLGALAGLLAFPLGLVLSYEMIAVINRRAFGWTITFQPDWTAVGESLVLALLAAFFSGLYPAWVWSHRATDESLRERE